MVSKLENIPYFYTPLFRIELTVWRYAVTARHGYISHNISFKISTIIYVNSIRGFSFLSANKVSGFQKHVVSNSDHTFIAPGMNIAGLSTQGFQILVSRVFKLTNH